MADLATIAKIPHVSSAVLGDLTGGFFDAIREPDGESVAAVAGFLSANFAQAGERLGLGTLARVSLAGGTRAFLIILHGDAVVAATVEPSGALPTVERALDGTPGVRG